MTADPHGAGEELSPEEQAARAEIDRRRQRAVYLFGLLLALVIVGLCAFESPYFFV